MTRHALIAFATACAVPFAAAAQNMQVPRMMKGMEKGQWRVEILEYSSAKPGQKMPVMTMCSDNLMQQAQEKNTAAKGDSKCKQRLVRDGANEAVMETTCPQRTVTTTLKRGDGKTLLMDIKSTGDKPMSMKMRYTSLGACREGQAPMTVEKGSK